MKKNEAGDLLGRGAGFQPVRLDPNGRLEACDSSAKPTHEPK